MLPERQPAQWSNTMIGDPEKKMKRKALTVALLSIVTLAAAPPSSVPIQDEPMHKLKLENEYVRVFDVVVPPHQQTLFHVHANDYVFVALGAAKFRSEKADGTSSVVEVNDGEARFTKGPLTHRAINIGETPFHNITVEILKSAASPPEPPLPKMTGHSVVLENERIRIDRQTLEPGESTGLHTHTLMSLGICVSPARVEYSEPGGKADTADLEAGQFNWHSGTRTHSLKNVGKTRFEAIEIEWK
jgi:quercetin dioxygenase-like cupin family protein